MSFQTFDDGQVIIRQGDIGEKFYVIYKGKVTVTMTDDNGNSKFLIELGEGEVFGMYSMYVCMYVSVYVCK